jgi:hypothetical protein
MRVEKLLLGATAAQTYLGKSPGMCGMKNGFFENQGL